MLQNTEYIYTWVLQQRDTKREQEEETMSTRESGRNQTQENGQNISDTYIQNEKKLH